LGGFALAFIKICYQALVIMVYRIGVEIHK